MNFLSGIIPWFLLLWVLVDIILLIIVLIASTISRMVLGRGVGRGFSRVYRILRLVDLIQGLLGGCIRVEGIGRV